jgi:hypothetical protein
MNLNELEAKAKAATENSRLIICQETIIPGEGTIHVQVASPDVILELIAALKSAREMAEHYDDMATYFDCVRRENSSVIVLEDGVRQKARDWLKKFGGGE